MDTLFDRLIRLTFIVAVALALIGSCTVRAHAGDLDTDYPVALEVTYQVIHAIDASQTVYIADHAATYREMNPLLGSHPSATKVEGYFVAGAALHALVTAALPPRVARVWEYISIGFETGMVVHNYSIGIRMKL